VRLLIKEREKEKSDREKFNFRKLNYMKAKEDKVMKLKSRTILKLWKTLVQMRTWAEIKDMGMNQRD
jgi:hypothetical protein